MEETSKDSREIPEELTEKMHSEFTVGEECERRHKVFTLIGMSGGTKNLHSERFQQNKKLLAVSDEDLEQFIDEYKVRYEQ